MKNAVTTCFGTMKTDC